MAKSDTFRSARIGLSVALSGIPLLFSATLFARTWNDSTGRYRVEAELRDVAADHVSLEKADGTVVQVPLDRLSSADQQYVRSELVRRAAAPPVFDGNKDKGLELCRSGKWSQGLSYLARCRDKELATIARIDFSLLNPPDGATAQAVKMACLVQGWERLAGRHQAEDRSLMASRAEHWRTRAGLWSLVLWGQTMMGQKIGNGQCTEVPRYALQETGSTTRRGWGRRLAGNETPLPGDILRLVAAQGRGFRTGHQHLAIIKRVVGSKCFEVYHQNSGGRQYVMTATFDVGTLTAGSYEVYRPSFARDSIAERLTAAP
jgi:hypothetical protein